MTDCCKGVAVAHAWECENCGSWLGNELPGDVEAVSRYRMDLDAKDKEIAGLKGDFDAMTKMIRLLLKDGRK